MVIACATRGAGAAVIFGLAACDAPVDYRSSVALSQQNTQVERDALDAAGRAFFGDQFPDDSDDDGLFDGEDPFASDRYDRTRSLASVARIQARAPLRQDWTVVGDLALSAGRSRYNLPDGTDVLTDPAVVTVSSVGLEGTLGVAYAIVQTARISSEVSAGVGLGIARTKAQISSNLLDVQEVSTAGTQYLFVGTSLRVQPRTPSARDERAVIDARLKRFESGAYDLQVAFGVEVKH